MEVAAWRKSVARIEKVAQGKSEASQARRNQGCRSSLAAADEKVTSVTINRWSIRQTTLLRCPTQSAGSRRFTRRAKLTLAPGPVKVGRMEGDGGFALSPTSRSRREKCGTTPWVTSGNKAPSTDRKPNYRSLACERIPACFRGASSGFLIGSAPVLLLAAFASGVRSTVHSRRRSCRGELNRVIELLDAALQ